MRGKPRQSNDRYQRAHIASLDRVATQSAPTSAEPLNQIAQTLMDIEARFNTAPPRDDYDRAETVAEAFRYLYEDETLRRMVCTLAREAGKSFALGFRDGMKEANNV